MTLRLLMIPLSMKCGLGSYGEMPTTALMVASFSPSQLAMRERRSMREPPPRGDSSASDTKLTADLSIAGSLAASEAPVSRLPWRASFSSSYLSGETPARKITCQPFACPSST